MIRQPGSILIPLATAVLLATGSRMSLAAPLAARTPQVAVAGHGLQSYMDGVGETLDVTRDQEVSQRWKASVSGNSAFTLLIDIPGMPGPLSAGLYNADGTGTPALFEIFPASALDGWHAVATFRPSAGQLVATVFDDDGALVSTRTHNGVNSGDFGYYLSGPGGMAYTEDARHDGSRPRVLVFAGTNERRGCWWLCFEDGNPADPDPDDDFDDVIVLIEPANATATNRTSWGSLKSRFR